MKQTEIGLIPDDWEVKRLNAICNNISSGKNQNRFVNGIYPVYGSTGIIGFCNNNKYSGDAILVARVGANAGLVNKVAGKYDVSDNTLVIQSDKCDIDYLSRLLAFRNLNQLIFGSGQPLITGGQLKALLIQLPSLTEQQRIAKALSDVDALIFTTEKLLQKKKNIKQGTMQELLTGKKRLPGFAKSNNTKMTELGEIPEDWEVKSVSSLLKIGHGKDYKNLKEGAVPVFGTGGYMTSVNDYLYDGDTVCIGRKGTIDKPFYHEGKIWTVDTLFYTYDFENCIPKYIYYSFCLVDWLSMNEASGIPSLTSKNIEDVMLRIPSKEEQNSIAKILSDMDNEIDLLNTKLEKYRNLKTAMMQQLLTGKIRLK